MPFSSKMQQKKEYSPAPDSERPWPGKWSDCSTAQEFSALCPGSAHIAHHTRAPHPHPDAERNGLAHMTVQKERFVKWPTQSPISYMVSVDIKHPAHLLTKWPTQSLKIKELTLHLFYHTGKLQAITAKLFVFITSFKVLIIPVFCPTIPCTQQNMAQLPPVHSIYVVFEKSA